jgi:hypothetical protein
VLGTLTVSGVWVPSSTADPMVVVDDVFGPWCVVP